MSFQESAGLDCQVIVEYISDHMRFSSQFDRTGSNLAVNRSMNDDGISNDLAFDVGRLTDKQCLGTNITLNCAIYLDLTVTTQISNDPKVFAN